ncbi:MAG: ribonuclease R [Sterolibacterium sp.]|nr:ribonuclease R [Sterolibacterium sp.]
MSKSDKSPRLSRVRRADPYLEREQGKYEHPLPSREYVIAMLENSGVPLEFERLCTELDVRADELVAFRRRLDAMARAGQLMQNRAGAWLLPAKAALIRGRVEGHADGYGFLIPDDRAEYPSDIFLGPREMEAIMHGDRAIVRVTGMDRRGRPEGKLVEILERRCTRLVGRVFNEHGVWFVVAENRRISQDILLAPPAPGSKSPEVRAGQVVTVEIIEPPRHHAQPIGRIIEVLGNYADPGMEIEIALRKHELPFEFSTAAEAEAKKLPLKVRKLDWKGREDITHLPLVTIDGETARDFDDAVYCEPLSGNGKRTGLFRLIVAIADVSHYVQSEAALDLDARSRGNSVYFPRRVIPMLPEKLSNGLCSLNPQVERLCMVCDMTITSSGRVENYRFYPAVMFSHARLTYTEVAAAIYEREPAAREKLAALLPQLESLDAVYRALAKARAKRGAIDFETAETRMIFDDNGKIDKIVATERNEAHRLIEECMLAANVCASAFLEKQKQMALYRVHEGPTTERLQRLREFLGGFGLQIGGGDSPKAKDYAELLTRLQGRSDKSLLQMVMLRSLRQAQYSPDNLGHFGLSYEAYTHFTSPIRRYPDLLIHRAIKAVLHQQKYQPGAEPGETAQGAWEKIGLHCSMTERRADEATRDVENWLKCYYMQDRIGEEYEGSISAVVPFGIFVALDEVFVEGLVHVSELGADYFHFDEAGHVMVGERTGRRFRLSDRVRVKVMRADLETNKIDFRLVENQPQPLRAQGRNAGSVQAVRSEKEVKSGKEGKGSKKMGVTPMPVAREVAPPANLKASAQSPAGKRAPGASRGAPGATGVRVKSKPAKAVAGKAARSGASSQKPAKPRKSVKTPKPAARAAGNRKKGKPRG